MKIYIRTRTEEQSRAVLEVLRGEGFKDAQETAVMLPLKTSCRIAEEMKQCGACVLADLPAIARENRMDEIKQAVKNAAWAEGYVIRNVDELGFEFPEGSRFIADPFLYAYNSHAAGFYKKIYPGIIFMAPDELTDNELKTLKDRKNIIYKIYGRQAVMFTAQSMSENYEGARGKTLSLESVKKDSFMAADEEFGFTGIYTSDPVSMLDKAGEMDIPSVMADLTLENAEDTKKVMESLIKVMSGKNADYPKNFLRGHHYKGID